MNKSPMKTVVLVFIVALALATVDSADVVAQGSEGGQPWDVVVRIEKINATLDIIDDLLGTSDQAGGQSPTAMLRGMLQGGDWIDPARSIVIGVLAKEPAPVAAAFIPFVRPSDNFKNMVNAASGPDYYLTTIPPGQPASFSAQQEKFLDEASRSTGQRTLSIECFPSQLVEKSDNQIKQMLMNLKTQPNAASGESMEFTPEEMRAMLEDMLEAVSQLDSFLIGFDLTSNAVAAAMEADALENTDLSRLFSPNATRTIFNDYKPAHQVTFKMGSFDLAGMMELIDKVFGETYAKLGLDFGQISSIAQYFTGETAGGLSYDITGASFESISVLKSPKSTPQFFDAVYLPWLKDYSENVRKMMEKRTGKKQEPMFRRTQDTMVSGYPTVGVDIQLPAAMMGPETSKSVETNPELFMYQMRMTIMDDLLLTAPHDERLAELIVQAGKLKAGPLRGPLGRFDIDMAAYFNALKDSVPGLEAPGPMPDMGRLAYTFDLEKGRMVAETSMKVKDIRNIVSYFKALSPSGETAETYERPARTRPEPEPEPEKARRKPPKTVERVEEPVKKDFDYYMDKGGLTAAYGNDAAAIKYYEQAIRLNPNRSDAYYSLGVSLGEIGRYAESLTALDQAISMEPRNGAYFYARGWVYLRAGNSRDSMIDMRRAADLGNNDAQNYLRRNSGFE